MPSPSPLLTTNEAWSQSLRKLAAHPDSLKQLHDESTHWLTTTPPDIVTNKKHLPASSNPHDYVSIAPYIWRNPATPDGFPWIYKDGEVNPGFYEYDNQKLETLCLAVSRLILQAHTTRSTDCAQAAGNYLRRWFLDPATRMNPNLNHAQFTPGVCTGRCFGIIDTTSLIFLLDTVTHLHFNESWTPQDLASLKEWFTQYLGWLLESELGKEEGKQDNNHGTWYDAQVICFAMFCEKPEIAQKQIEHSIKKRITSQIEPDGSQPHELSRTLSLTYSTYNLLALACAAHIATHFHIDLWNWKAPNGANILTALQFLLPFFSGEKEWSHKQIKPFDPTSCTLLLQLAWQNTSDKTYLTLCDTLEKDPWQRITFSKASMAARKNPTLQSSHLELIRK